MNLVRRSKISLSANQSRILYDFLAITGATAFLYLFTLYNLNRSLSPVMFVGAPLFIAACAIGGIFGRFRMASGRQKAIVLSLALFITTAALGYLTADPSSCLLWLALTWAPIVLPRIFLNFNVRHNPGLISTAIREKGPVLVVGGGGYIGSYVVEQLLNQGQSVRVLDRFIYGREPLQEFTKNPRLEIVEGDVTDIMKLTDAMSGASAVVHMAGLVGDPACSVDEGFTRHTNIIATRMAKEVALSLGIPRFIFASSCSVYGSSDTEVDETSVLNPVSLYARTKIDSERELLSCINEMFCVTILRFATVFGHSRRPRFDLVANLFAAQALHEGKILVTGENQWRPFIHVRDLARAIIATLKAPSSRVQGQIFNVGDSRLNMTIGQLAKVVQHVIAQERPVEIVTQNNISDPRNYAVSFAKIKRILGFQAEVLMEPGIQEILREHRNGSYAHYRSAPYSNLEMTRRALQDFLDPEQTSRLYQPLTDDRLRAKAASNS